MAKKRRTENMQPNVKHGTMGKTSPTCNEICFRIICRGECPVIHCRDKKPYIVPGTPYTKIAKISCRSCRKTHAITNMTCAICRLILPICRCTFDDNKGHQKGAEPIHDLFAKTR